jgi:RNA-directed DNA polymerase
VKSSVIGKRLIYGAGEKVRASNGAPGMDAVGIGLFQEQVRDNLYKLWNRMSSGSYFPGAGAGRGDTGRSRGRRAFARA